eukprot:gene27862-12039_t
MLDLLSQLQDMGGNKEEMVASISSLLAELILYQRSSSEPGAMLDLASQLQVLDLVSQLQDMGGNKEEMAASISSLLAELTYVQ